MPTSRLTHTGARVSEQAPPRKIEFHESGDRAPTDFFPPRFFFPLGPTDCVCFFFFLVRVFYRADSPSFVDCTFDLKMGRSFLASSPHTRFTSRLGSQLDSARQFLLEPHHYRVFPANLCEDFFFFSAPFSGRLCDG